MRHFALKRRALRARRVRLEYGPDSGADASHARRRSSDNALPFARHRRARRITIGVLVCVVLAGTLWWRSGPTQVAYATAPVERGTVAHIVVASGMVNPVETVQIGSYVSGRIQDIYCDYNSKVVKGQRCAKIDPRSYQAAVSQAAAALDTGKAQLGKDQANLDYAKGAYERAQALWSRQVASKDALQNALKTYRQTQAQIDLDKAVIGQHEAELNAAKVNLDYTNIISPVDGTVVSRNAAIGQTVTASFQTPTLFVIATDLTHMQVDTNVTEAAIGEIHEGQKVTFTVPAFPGRTFEGVVTQVRQAPVSVQNVISYDAVISVDNRDHALKPGMTATAHIVAAQHDNVLRVPERALRFTPGAPSPMTSTHDKRQHVWVLRDGKPAAVPVTTGLHDDEYVELTGDAIAANAQVIVGKARPATTVAVQP